VTYLEQLLGKRSSAIEAADIERLAAMAVDEDDSLEYKRQPWGKDDKQECAKDIAGLADGQGGVIVLGIDETARVISTSPFELPNELGPWIHSVLHSRLRPVPAFDCRVIANGDGRHYALISVPRSPDAPHSIDFGETQSCGFPIRRGASTQWLREYEVAALYRSRFAAQLDRQKRLSSLVALATNEPPATEPRVWLTMTVVPLITGIVRIGRDTPRRLMQALNVFGEPYAFKQGNPFRPQAWRLGPRMVRLRDHQDVSIGELHVDGSVWLRVSVEAHWRTQRIMLQHEPQPEAVEAAYLIPHISALLGAAARYATEEAGCLGTCLVHVNLGGRNQVGTRASYAIMHQSGPELRPFLGDAIVSETSGSQTVDLADHAFGPCEAHVRVVRALAEELFQAAGAPDLPQLDVNGKVRTKAWPTSRRQQIIEWCAEFSIPTSDEECTWW
jgi:Putative DNA-binding domain